MNILAIMASYRKGHATDTLVDQAIAGALAAHPGATADKITLVDRHIEYCRNCMACRDDDPAKPLAHCVIPDDMQAIYPALDAADAFIFGTPVNLGHETAILKTFMERCCYVLSKPGNFPLQGVPTPRTRRKKQAVAIIGAGSVPPWLRLFCDQATPLIKDFCHSMLNARLVGSLYAGALHRRGTDAYRQAAFRLGEKLGR